MRPVAKLAGDVHMHVACSARLSRWPLASSEGTRRSLEIEKN
jgi:hypothetical protein